MMKYLAKVNLFALLFLFSCQCFAQYEVQDARTLNPLAPVFEVKAPKVMTPYFTITLPPSLKRGDIEDEGHFVGFSSLVRSQNKYSKESLSVTVYPNISESMRKGLIKVEMGDGMRIYIDNPTSDEKNYLREAVNQTPQEFKANDRTYALTAFSIRNLQIVFICTTQKNITYIFRLVSINDDKTIRQNQINEMMASIKSIEYNDAPVVNK